MTDKNLSTKTEAAPYKDIDYSLVNEGPLYIPQEYLHPDFRYEFVTADGGAMKIKERLGYEVVLDFIPEGEKKPSQSSRHGSTFTVQSKCGQVLTLMKIHKELHAKFMAHKHAEIKKNTDALGTISGIPANAQYGQITYTKK